MKRKWIAMLLALAGLASLTGCSSCEHAYIHPATCLDPKTCAECGEVLEASLGEHAWKEANCTNPKTCSLCGAEEGEMLGHQWLEATCAAPKTCEVCEMTLGECRPHTWQDATCTAAVTCEGCGKTEGQALGHDVVQELYEIGTCTRCGGKTGTSIWLELVRYIREKDEWNHPDSCWELDLGNGYLIKSFRETEEKQLMFCIEQTQTVVNETGTTKVYYTINKGSSEIAWSVMTGIQNTGIAAISGRLTAEGIQYDSGEYISLNTYVTKAMTVAEAQELVDEEFLDALWELFRFKLAELGFEDLTLDRFIAGK